MSDDLRLCLHCQKRETRMRLGPKSDRPDPITDAEELARIAEMLDEMGVPRGDRHGLWRVSYRLQHAQSCWTDQVMQEVCP